MPPHNHPNGESLRACHNSTEPENEFGLRDRLVTLVSMSGEIRGTDNTVRVDDLLTFVPCFGLESPTLRAATRHKMLFESPHLRERPVHKQLEHVLPPC